VSFVAAGTYTLTAEVAAGATYAATTGTPQSFTVKPAVAALAVAAPDAYAAHPASRS
jgi:hypothetical protein